jgi:hypothetical protein
MSPAYLFGFDARIHDLQTEDRRIPVPPGSEEPEVKEPPETPRSAPDAPVDEPEPEAPTRLKAA